MSQLLPYIIYAHSFNLHNNICGKYSDDFHFRKEVKYLGQSPGDKGLIFRLDSLSQSPHTYLLRYFTVHDQAFKGSYKRSPCQ